MMKPKVKQGTKNLRRREAYRAAFLFKIAPFATLLLLSLVMVIPARAIPTSFDWGSFSASGSTQYGVYEDDGNTVLASDDLVQLIWVGPNGQVEPPSLDGAPGGDDQLLDSNQVNNGQPLPPLHWNKGYVPLKTYTFDTEDPHNGGTVYLRAWNAAATHQATGYGDSETGTLRSGGILNARRWQVADAPTAVTLGHFEASSQPAVEGYLVLLVGFATAATVLLVIRGKRSISGQPGED